MMNFTSKCLVFYHRKTTKMAVSAKLKLFLHSQDQTSATERNRTTKTQYKDLSDMKFIGPQNFRGWKRPQEITESNPAAKAGPYSRAHKQASREVLNMSRGDHTTFQHRLFQCSAPLTAQNFFLVLVWNFLGSRFCLLPLVLLLLATEKSLTEVLSPAYFTQKPWFPVIYSDS